MPDMLKFDLPKNQSNIIKVIGVGGGGSNAVTHMYRQGIKGVDFIICNTDAQAMETSPVPVKIQLGTHLTGGLGAGAVPSIGRNSALENTEDIRAILSSGTKMVFITAGLGGGTGTGAAPVIAQISKEMGILTVAIVTIPFMFEGRKRKLHADDGIRQLKQHVDALLIISNDKLRELYGDLRLSEAFGRADNVLTTAAKGIAEIITVAGYINVDFEDVKTVMKDSGVAIMGTGIASGENRALNAVEMALSSPLLNNNDIEGACNLLLYIASGKDEITMDEVTDITDFIQAKTKNSAEVIWGNGFDETLEDKISVTIIATGFDEEHRPAEDPSNRPKKVRSLYEETVKPPSPAPAPEPVHEPVAEITHEPVAETSVAPELMPEPEFPAIAQREITFDFEISSPVEETRMPEEHSEQKVPFNKVVETIPEPVDEVPMFIPSVRTEPAAPAVQPNETQDKRFTERVVKLRALSEKLKSHTPIENNLTELEAVPAYKRRNVELSDVPPSSESNVPKYSLTNNQEGPIEIRTENTFLHNNVD
jgi:cell division protein FtsZ